MAAHPDRVRLRPVSALTPLTYRPITRASSARQAEHHEVVETEPEDALDSAEDHGYGAYSEQAERRPEARDEPIKSVTPTKVDDPASDLVPRHTAHCGLPIRSPTLAALGRPAQTSLRPARRQLGATN